MTRFILVPFVAAVALFTCRSGGAQSMGPLFEGISVNGNGEVYTKPDIVEINVRLHGNAELTDDAIIKHRDARGRVQKAFEGLKFNNVKTEKQSQ
jgi:uncharacterized protein YggE